MNEIHRFSSRREHLARSFLSQRLKGACSYRRIAGYFRSSIFELVGEEIAEIPKVQVVCNSDLDVNDIAISRHAREVAMKERFNKVSPEIESLLRRDCYRRLYELLVKGNLEVRVVARDRAFVHGKAGVIELVDGTKTAFLGSANETRSAFDTNYELIWEDPSPEAVSWVEEEFNALWQNAYPMPNAIVEEVGRIARRIEIRFEDTMPEELPGAALAESPIYRSGEELQAWQRSFVTISLRHRETYGQIRLLLADEVGVGKTLSMAASAMIAALLGDGPVLILAPATLTLQWQVELKDRLGIPSVVWSSQKKVWMDQDGHIIKTKGPGDIAQAPLQIAIVSTGLIFHRTSETDALLGRRYGSVVLDEAHRARMRGGLGKRSREPNNLLAFMQKIAEKTRHLILGTATPIQTDVCELWDLLDILNQGAGFVLGHYGIWHNCDMAIPIIKGERLPQDEKEAWDWLSDPMPPAEEDTVFSSIRLALDMDKQEFRSPKGFGSLDSATRQVLGSTLSPEFFKRNNPVLRHTVIRRRRTLEEKGLLPRIAVNIHPNPHVHAIKYRDVVFDGLGLLTNPCFDRAYQAAEEFTRLLRMRTRTGGFVKTMMLQRISSSFAAGRNTAQKILQRKIIDDDEEMGFSADVLSSLTPAEAEQLQIIVDELSREDARDPKLNAVYQFLTQFRSNGRLWLELGCIIFSQYYDTVYWIAKELARRLPDEFIAIYAGAGKSSMFHAKDFAHVEREEVKKAVKDKLVRVVVATEAAAEGLNLQTLGTLINIDLPWNPSRLEQRLGRIRRIGQARKEVDMLNLVYKDTQDEKIYQVLSRRMKDRYDIFGSVPDVIEDTWIEDIEHLEEMMDKYMHLRSQARDAFSIRYEEEIDPDRDRWDLAERVLSQRDIRERLSEPW